MAIYLKYGDLKGGVTTQGVEEWIELESFQFGVGRGVGSARGGSTRETSEASVSEISVSKKLDVASGALLEEALWGKGKDATVKFSRTGTTGDKTEFFLVYELKEAIIAGHSVSSGGERPMESISLNFNAFKMETNLGASDNEAGGAYIMGYDLTKATKI